MSASGVRSRAAATMARNSSVSVGLSVAGQFGPWGVISTAESATIRTTSARKAWGSWPGRSRDRKSTRLNSSHLVISYAVFCLKKKIVGACRLAADGVELDVQQTAAGRLV